MFGYGTAKQFYEMNLATGFAADTGYSAPGRVVTFDNSGVLYALDTSTSPYRLHTIDFQSKSITKTIGLSYSSIEEIWDMAFTANGLIAITRTGGLLKIDHTSGAVSSYAAVGTGNGLVSGLAPGDQ